MFATAVAVTTIAVPVAAVDDLPPTPHVALEHVYATNDIVLEGTATDDSAVVRVRVGVKQDRTKLWLQKDGTFGDKVQKFDAVLDAAGSPTTNWMLDVHLPDGGYVVSVRAFDDAGNSESLKPWRRFKVDSVGPTIEVAFLAGATLLGPDVVINGRLVDRSTIGRTEVAIKDRSSGLWLQADGSFASSKVFDEIFEWTCRPAQREFCLPGTPNDSDETIMAFTTTVELPAGDYALAMRVSDSHENVSYLTPWRRFSVSPTIGTLPIPTADLKKGEVFGGEDITLTGIAEDDIGIARVRVGIKNRDTGGWVRFDADVEDLGSSHTKWRLETELPDGRYALSVRAFDVQGYSDSIKPWVWFTVNSSA